ncbi:hypothetical protein [Reichenbachiella sp.]|uniref:hypothetical protein n=1 Tax=Reichenbachiella sp. TaxID=2184521 RepID=UPI003BAE9F1C
MDFRLILTLLLLPAIGSCQTQKAVYDIESPYKGFVVVNDIELYEEDKVDWFVPTIDEIREAEGILKDQIESLNKDEINQDGSCPVVHKSLRKYTRQYIGYVTSEGSKVIFINLFWSKNLKALESMKYEYRLMLDGCSYFWRVKVDLNKKSLFDLDINGSA